MSAVPPRMILYAIGSLALLAACSDGLRVPSQNGGVSTLPAIRGTKIAHSLPAPFVDVASVNAAGGAEVIVSDNINSAVSVFGAAGRRNAYIRSGIKYPTGITTDGAQTLYIANTGDDNILIYRKPYSSLSRRFKDVDGMPIDVAVSNTGLLAVTNLSSTAGLAGNISIYAADSQKPCATVRGSNLYQPYSGAFDALGNLFFDGVSLENKSYVGEVSGGCHATSITRLTVNNTLFAPSSLHVQKGKILILDFAPATPGPIQGNQNPVIYSYAAPSGSSLGHPVLTTNLTPGTLPVVFALMKNGDRLWTVHSGAAAGRIEYTYPTGQFVRSVNENENGEAFLPQGLAVNPASLP